MKVRLGCAGHLKRLECKIYTPPPHQLHNTFQDNCYSNDDVYDEHGEEKIWVNYIIGLFDVNLFKRLKIKGRDR